MQNPGGSKPSSSAGRTETSSKDYEGEDTEEEIRTMEELLKEKGKNLKQRVEYKQTGDVVLTNRYGSL